MRLELTVLKLFLLSCPPRLVFVLFFQRGWLVYRNVNIDYFFSTFFCGLCGDFYKSRVLIAAEEGLRCKQSLHSSHAFTDFRDFIRLWLSSRADRHTKYSLFDSFATVTSSLRMLSYGRVAVFRRIRSAVSRAVQLPSAIATSTCHAQAEARMTQHHRN